MIIYRGLISQRVIFDEALYSKRKNQQINEYVIIKKLRTKNLLTNIARYFSLYFFFSSF